jgi:hypothetical protein
MGRYIKGVGLSLTYGVGRECTTAVACPDAGSYLSQGEGEPLAEREMRLVTVKAQLPPGCWL